MSLDGEPVERENPGMPKQKTCTLHLRRINPDRNMRRFYTLTIQPTLFGGVSLVRNWGRIGTNGQSIMKTFDDPRDADDALSCLERIKRRRGYVDADNTGSD